MYGIKEIAQKINVSDKTIRRRIKELNIKESVIDKSTGRKLFSEESLLLLEKSFRQPLDSSLDSAQTTARQGIDSLDTDEKTLDNERLDSLDNDETTPRQEEKDPLLSLLEKQLDTLQEQLNQKDKQIQDLSTLLSREQELNRHNQLQIEDLNKRLLIYTPKEEDNIFSENETIQEVNTTNTVKKEKKSFWERLFNH